MHIFKGFVGNARLWLENTVNYGKIWLRGILRRFKAAMED